MEFSSTEQTVSWFRDRYLEGSLELKPLYQRNAVWMPRQKSWLIESVLKRMPIPEVFVQKITDEEGRTEYSVVDGQQRIRALLQFVGGDSDPDQIEYDKFSLDKLDPASPWFGLAFSDLTPEDKRSFYNYSLSVRYLNSDSDEDMKEMFRRINKFTLPLKAQELRNATYGGPFIRLTTKLAEDFGDFLAENRIVSAAAIRRMNDVEYIAELLIGAIHGPQGGQPTTIDEYFFQYEDYEDEFPGERDARRSFVTTIALLERIVPDIRPTRWANKSDFYSLFVVLTRMQAANEFDPGKIDAYRDILGRFAADIDERLRNDEAPVSRHVLDYIKNVQKGANDKARRASRHAALRNVLLAA